MILSDAKTWELRNSRVHKRGRFYLAAAGQNQLVGEFSLVDCLAVGRRDSTGAWQPVSDSAVDAENFCLNPANMAKHAVDDLNALAKYKVLFAWVLDEVVAFAEPRAWVPRKGAIKFCNVAPEGPVDQKKGQNRPAGQAQAAQPQDKLCDPSSIEVVPGSDKKKKKKDKKNKKKDNSTKGKKKCKKEDEDKRNKKKNKKSKSSGSSSRNAASKKGSDAVSPSTRRKHKATPAETEDEAEE